MSKNPFEEKKVSYTPFIVIGIILVLAITILSVYIKSKQPEEIPSEVTPPISSDVSPTITVDPSNPNNTNEPTTSPTITGDDVSTTISPTPTIDPEGAVDINDVITSENIGEHVEELISGQDLEYFLATMKDEYAYMISCDSVNRSDGIYGSDLTTVSFIERDGDYIVRMTKDSLTGSEHIQRFFCIGHTIDGMTTIKWDERERVFYSSGELRLADVGKKMKNPETGEVYVDVYIKAFLSWDYRDLFSDDEMFRINKLISSRDGSLLGYVFEQADMQFIQ